MQYQYLQLLGDKYQYYFWFTFIMFQNYHCYQLTILLGWQLSEQLTCNNTMFGAIERQCGLIVSVFNMSVSSAPRRQQLPRSSCLFSTLQWSFYRSPPILFTELQWGISARFVCSDVLELVTRTVWPGFRLWMEVWDADLFVIGRRGTQQGKEHPWV